MRYINGLNTQRNNRLKKTDGAIFRGRYNAILIDASGYLLQVSRYIHRNPVETRPPPVQLLRDYSWSSYVACLDAKLRPIGNALRAPSVIWVTTGRVVIKRMFNVRHYSTLAQTIRPSNVLLAESPALRDEWNVISQDLTP